MSMKPKWLLISVFVCGLFSGSSAQEWSRIYFPTKSTVVSSVFETYDRGYVLGGDFESGGIPARGLILRTDINGYALWYKTVSENNDFTSIWDINATSDNGLILTGVTGEQTNNLNPFIMKLNACADPEWCRIYNLPNVNPEWGQSIWQMPGGYIALFYAYGQNSSNERIWLYRLKENGDLLWTQLYTQSDTSIKYAEGVHLHVTHDLHFIISGDCYYPDPNVSYPLKLRPLIIKVDSTGGLQWELPWSLLNGENFYGQSYCSATDNQGTTYSASRHIVKTGPAAGDKPCMIKTDYSGNESDFIDLFPNSKMGSTSTISWFEDSTLAIGYFSTDTITPSLDGTVGVVRCTRNGYIILDKPIIINSYLFSDAVTSFDNKLLLVGSFPEGINWITHSYKLNCNLEFDSIYTHPRVYDSLCPYPIPSDTIPLNCLLVGREELAGEEENSKLAVYPNPAAGTVHIVIPDQLKTVKQASVFTVTTWRARWEKTELEVYDLFGRRVYSKALPFGEKSVTLDVSAWKTGMYLIRLVYNGSTVAGGRLVRQ